MRAAWCGLLAASIVWLCSGNAAALDQTCADFGIAPEQGWYNKNLQDESAHIERLLPRAAEAAGVGDFNPYRYTLAFCGVMRKGRRHVVVLGSRISTLVITCDDPENFSVDYDLDNRRFGRMRFGVKTCHP